MGYWRQKAFTSGANHSNNTQRERFPLQATVDCLQNMGIVIIYVIMELQITIISLQSVREITSKCDEPEQTAARK